MIDVFRSLKGFGELSCLDVSHATQTDNPKTVPPEDIEGKRFDHIIASEKLNPVTCRYEARGFKHSDHAPIIADFSP